MWFSVVIGQQFGLVSGMLELPLFLSVVRLLVLGGYGGEKDVLKEDKPVLAVASSLLVTLVLLLVVHSSKDLVAVPGSLRFRDSPMWGSTDPIDASVPVLQYEICCPIMNKCDMM